ncbi:MAG: MarR family transcriptional regulator [Frankia sp.]|nr:MarR family transcriptional regulator [Frankia sp.]
MSDAAVDRIERELSALGRRADRIEMRAPGDTEPPLDRAAYRLLGYLVEYGPSRLTAMGSVFMLDLSTISRQAAALDAAGLIERVADPTDRRAALIQITRAGRERFERTRAGRAAGLAAAIESWSEQDRETLADLLHRLNVSLGARDPRRPVPPSPPSAAGSSAAGAAPAPGAPPAPGVPPAPPAASPAGADAAQPPPASPPGPTAGGAGPTAAQVAPQ